MTATATAVDRASLYVASPAFVAVTEQVPSAPATMAFLPETTEQPVVPGSATATLTAPVPEPPATESAISASTGPEAGAMLTDCCVCLENVTLKVKAGRST